VPTDGVTLAVVGAALEGPSAMAATCDGHVLAADTADQHAGARRRVRAAARVRSTELPPLDRTCCFPCRPVDDGQLGMLTDERLADGADGAPAAAVLVLRPLA